MLRSASASLRFLALGNILDIDGDEIVDDRRPSSARSRGEACPTDAAIPADIDAFLDACSFGFADERLV